jgi:transaldolase
MAKPTELTTKIFLDSGDPAETKQIIDILGFLDGQTTNPTLVSKNPYAQERLKSDQKFSKTEIFDFYKQMITEISGLIPEGSISIEVYGDAETTADAMFAQGQDMFTWIPNAQVKYPIISAGLEAAERSIAAGMRVNMTLCFSQQQAAAVYAATRGANPGDVYVSPFIGRLDDIGINGMDLIANIVQMYQPSDHHAQVLSASARTMEHFMQCLAVGSDLITAPFAVLKAWGEAGTPLPDETFRYDSGQLTPVAYEETDLSQPWHSYNIQHDLTDQGLVKFAADWNALIV